MDLMWKTPIWHLPPQPTPQAPPLPVWRGGVPAFAGRPAPHCTPQLNRGAGGRKQRLGRPCAAGQQQQLVQQQQQKVWRPALDDVDR